MIYLYWYLAVTLLVAFPFFCWVAYMTSFDHPEYRYLRIGDMLICLVYTLVPGLNLIAWYCMISEIFIRGLFDNFFNIIVFKGKGK